MAASSRKLDNTLKEINTSILGLNSAVSQLMSNLEKMGGEASSSVKDVNRLAASMAELADNSDTISIRYKKMIGILKDLVKAQKAGAEGLPEALNSANKDAKELLKSFGATTDEAKSLKKVIEATEGGIDKFAKEAEGAIKQMQSAIQALTNIKWDRPRSFFKEMESSINSAAKTMARMDNLGFKGTFGRISAMRENVARMRKDLESDTKYKMDKYLGKDRLGAKGMSREDTLDLFSKGSRKYAAQDKLQGIYKGMSPEDRAGMVRTLSGKTGITGYLDRKLGSLALESLGKAGAKSMAGKAGMSLLASGGGSVIGGLISKAAGPISLVSGLLDVAQMGYDRNKDINAKLGRGLGLGDTGRSARDTYNEMSKNLQSKALGFEAGTGTFYGIDFEKAMDMMKTVVESGQMIGGVTKGRNIDEVLKGGRSTDIFSGVMRSSIFGRGLGMDEAESVQTAMKYMEQFNLSMGEVEDMFVHLNKAVVTSGISTTKYLNMIDNITSQFDKMNKSLNFTTTLMLTLGKNARFTSDDIQNMTKSLIGEKKDMTMSTFAYRQMGAAGRENYAAATEEMARKSGQEVSSRLKLSRPIEKYTEAELLRMVPENDKDLQAVVSRYFNERLRATAVRANVGNDLGMAAVDVNLGETPQSSLVKNLTLLQTSIRESGGGGLASAFGPGGEARRAKLVASPEFAEISRALQTDQTTALKYLSKAYVQFGDQFKIAAGEGAEAEKAQKELGLTPDQITQLKKQTEGGQQAETTQVFKSWFEKSGIAGMSTTITEQMREDTQKKLEDSHRYITGPMDYIKKAVGNIAENTVKLLNESINFFNFSMFEKGRGVRELEKGILFNGQTQQTVAEMQGRITEGNLSSLPDNFKHMVKTAQETLEAMSKDTKGAAPELSVANFRSYLADIIDVIQQSRGKIPSDVQQIIENKIPNLNLNRVLLDYHSARIKEAVAASNPQKVEATPWNYTSPEDEKKAADAVAAKQKQEQEIGDAQRLGAGLPTPQAPPLPIPLNKLGFSPTTPTPTPTAASGSGTPQCVIVHQTNHNTNAQGGVTIVGQHPVSDSVERSVKPPKLTRTF